MPIPLSVKTVDSSQRWLEMMQSTPRYGVIGATAVLVFCIHETPCVKCHFVCFCSKRNIGIHSRVAEFLCESAKSLRPLLVILHMSSPFGCFCSKSNKVFGGEIRRRPQRCPLVGRALVRPGGVAPGLREDEGSMGFRQWAEGADAWAGSWLFVCRWMPGSSRGNSLCVSRVLDGLRYCQRLGTDPFAGRSA